MTLRAAMISIAWVVCWSLLPDGIDGQAVAAPGEPPRMEKLAALPSSDVHIDVQGLYRVITSNGIPDHPPGDFPRRGNPNAIRPQHYTFRVAVKPKALDKPV